MAQEPVSPLERIKQLDEERNRLMEEAKREALEKATQAVADLNALGLNYRLTEMVDDTPPRRHSSGDEGRKGTRQPTPGRACPVCKFVTDPPHDGRAHKKHPEPFRDDELDQRGMRRI